MKRWTPDSAMHDSPGARVRRNDNRGGNCSELYENVQVAERARLAKGHSTGSSKREQTGWEEGRGSVPIGKASMSGLLPQWRNLIGHLLLFVPCAQSREDTRKPATHCFNTHEQLLCMGPWAQSGGAFCQVTELRV